MADRISTLPDKLLCHILSFLPTKKAVATCVLSKRWKPLWRSVPALNFADYLYIDRTETYGEWTYFKFVQSVYAVLVSRDPRQPIQRFSLTCGCSNFVDPNDINIWVYTVLQCGIEHLHLSLGLNHKIFNSSSAVISCRTLLVLKLDGLATGPFSSVDLPCLKILDLDAVQFLEPKYFAKLLSGCPVLEILKVVSVYYESKKSFLEAFKCLHLPKLVRAHIGGFYMYLLKAVNNAEFLDINEMDVFDHHQGMDCIDYITDTMFSNVTHIELSYFKYNNRNWPLLLEVLDHCPKLQVLVISKVHRLLPDHSYIEETEGDWPYPQSVPTCILLHLKKCSLKSYDGMKGEFRFARYILRNARFLQRMTICNCSRSLPRRNKLKMIKKLSLCTRCSPTCKLSFK